MQTRRDFIKLATTAGIAASTTGAMGGAAEVSEGRVAVTWGRSEWCDVAAKLAEPVLTAAASRRLKLEMPVEAHDPKARAPFSHLEALSRLLCGVAPWLNLGADASAEGRVRERLGGLAREAVDAATDPSSPDFLNFSHGGQPLVDAAFLAQAMLRAPDALWGRLPSRVQRNVIAALKASRVIQPGENNWVLFASEVEAFLQRVGDERNDRRLFDGLRKFQRWYLGDGWYGDGAEFHWDYYNSFVIHPMLLEVLDVVGDDAEEWRTFRQEVRVRLTRFAAIQERLIAPDGSFPVIGRSMAYRCGAFQVLALAALRRLLPDGVTPPQARAALGSVIRRTLGAAGTWDEKGWLRIGLSGHQPDVAEPYISTGSLYLCSTALLPLGLPASDVFWANPPARTTWEKVWSGEDIPADHAIKSVR